MSEKVFFCLPDFVFCTMVVKNTRNDLLFFFLFSGGQAWVCWDKFLVLCGFGCGNLWDNVKFGKKNLTPFW